MKDSNIPRRKFIAKNLGAGIFFLALSDSVSGRAGTRPAHRDCAAEASDNTCNSGSTDERCRATPGVENSSDPDGSCGLQTPTGSEADNSCGDCDDNHDSDNNCGGTDSATGAKDPDDDCGHQSIIGGQQDATCNSKDNDEGCGSHHADYSGTWSDADENCSTTNTDANCNTNTTDSTCNQTSNPSTTSPDEKCGKKDNDEACGRYDNDESCGLTSGERDEECGTTYSGIPRITSSDDTKP